MSLARAAPCAPYGVVEAAVVRYAGAITRPWEAEMPPSVTRPTYPCPRCGTDAPMMRLSEADLRRAGYTIFGRDQYFVNSCGHGQEFITVPDTAGMWWLVAIIREAS